jgi:uncharacterized protein (TIGR02270 family)
MIRTYTRPAPITDILEEHVEEAAFLYEIRCRSFSDPELSPEDLRDYEGRMFRHLHSLALGGFTSAKLLKGKLILDEDEEPGETFVAAIVYSMLDLIEPMQWLVEAISQNPPHLSAIVDGLKLSKGKELEGWLEYFLGHENQAVSSVGAEVVGYRGITKLQDALVSLQQDPDSHVSMSAIHSLARMGVMPAKEKIVHFLQDQDPDLVWSAVELLLRMGEPEAIAFCREKCSTPGPEINQKLVFSLGIAGTLNDAELVMNLMERQPAIKKECFLALAMCGHPGTIDLLLDHLENIDDLDTYTAAYQGLRILSGADYLPEFDPDECEPDEILEYQRIWKNWWIDNGDTFRADAKWRRGEKISPLVLYKDLLWPGNPCRDMTYLEMVVRYGCTVSYQYDQLYDVQEQQLQKLHEWANRQNNKVHHGITYFHGRALS